MLGRLPMNVDNGRSRSDHPRRNSHDSRLVKPGECPRANPVRWHEGSADPRIAVLRKHYGDLGIGTDLDPYLAEIQPRVGMQPPEPTQRRKSPLLFPPGRYRKIIRRKRSAIVQLRDGAAGLDDPTERTH